MRTAGPIDGTDSREPCCVRSAFDMSRSSGRANRRLLYDEKGRFTAVEDDPDGDGTFVPMTGKAAADATGGSETMIDRHLSFSCARRRAGDAADTRGRERRRGAGQRRRRAHDRRAA